jgi:hypothetical protein
MVLRQPAVTRDTVRQLTIEWAHDPSSVEEIRHYAFNADQVNGGFAFRCDRGLMISTVDGGSQSWSVDPGDPPSRIAAIERSWRDAQHRNRPLGLDDVTAWHRAAIRALTDGVSSVGALPPELRRGVPDTSQADYLLVFLKRCAKERTQDAALRALAAEDWLMKVPGKYDRAHPCPLCGKPAIGDPWQYISVCDACYPMTACSHERRVTGYNTSIGGGFEAQHVDDKSVCEQVTRDGIVWVFERECHMSEAKFGGVFVGVEPDRPV